jgi:putative colanic acid biosynthesis acetyltransferase WcaF
MQRARITRGNRLRRALWKLVQATLYRWSPTALHGWRSFLLRCFGARVGRGAHPYPGARIWAPWNLTMEEDSCLADQVDCYCVAPIHLGAHATVSQYSYLCSASHDYRDPSMPLIIAPIVIESEAWVAADVFVGPGVRIGAGAVVGARSSVIQDVESWQVVAGVPAIPRGMRTPFTREASSRLQGAPTAGSIARV